MPKLLFYTETNQGRVRTNNEDSYIAQTVWDDNHYLLAAIDGMGGYEGGEVAAEIARKTIIDIVEAGQGEKPLELLKRAVNEANNEVVRQHETMTQCPQMGCVLTVGLFDLDQHKLFVAHVGDSRLYELCNGELRKLTHDHTLVGYREEQGELTEEEAMHHPQRNLIERYVGEMMHTPDDADFIEASVFPIMPGAQYLLCSDGLFDMITSVDITLTMSGKASLQQKGHELIQHALDAGGEDNVTVVLAQIPDVPKPVQAAPKPAPAPASATNQYVSAPQRERRETTPLWRGFLRLAAISAAFVMAMMYLQMQQSPRLDEVDKLIAEGHSMSLSASTDSVALANLLQTEGYLLDPNDAQLTANWIVRKLKEGAELPNLGSLNRPAFAMPAVLADSLGGESLKSRVQSSQVKLGLTDEVRAIYAHPDSLAFYNKEALDNISKIPCAPAGAPTKMTVKVVQRDNLNGMSKLIKRLTGGDTHPVEGTLVRLQRHMMLYKLSEEGAILDSVASEALVGYAFTGADGCARFDVNEGCYYSVIPIREGFEFGRSRGTVKGAVNGPMSFEFTQREHRISPFDSGTYMRLKDNHVLTARTPAQHRSAIRNAMLIFLAAWWITFIFLAVTDRIMGRRSERAIPLMLTGLTAFCVLIMFAIVDPLADMQLGPTMVKGVVFGLCIFCLLSLINFVKFYLSQSKTQMGFLRFDFVWQFIAWTSLSLGQKIAGFRVRKGEKVTAWRILRFYVGMLLSVLFIPFQLVFGAIGWCIRWIAKRRSWNISHPDGIGYLLTAMVLVVLLRLFGTGPEGSDARVNLFFFQPSEISKYLVVVAFAAFFAANAQRIQAFSERADKLTIRLQVRLMLGIGIGIIVLLGMYLGLISDMGPALVLLLTFIILYSIARRDLLYLLLGVLTFAVLLLLAVKFGASTLILIVLALAWFVGWIGLWWFTRHRVYESAVFMNLLIVAFALGGRVMQAVGLASEAARLTNRTDVAWSGIWNNDVPGGDQVAQGIWALASGGLTGQGLGHGNANLVPAFSTDMVFICIGEVMGWIALLAVIFCFAGIIYRSLILARRAGHPFAFYLMAGIAIVTGVQFLVIVTGSLGLMPLTGVAVPLLSYGLSSLIINLGAFGIIEALTRFRPTDRQRTSVAGYDNVVVGGIVSFGGAALIILGVLFNYQVWNRDTYLIRPAFVTTMDGEKIAEYNPRINLVIRELKAGNIYDRNGLLLATSDREDMLKYMEDYVNVGLDSMEVRAESTRRQSRFYPFGNHLFFMIGDMNTHYLWLIDDINPFGYLAESRHEADLRGFNTLGVGEGQRIVDTLHTDKHRVSPYMPPTSLTRTITRRDYSALLPMLKTGADGAFVKMWNEKSDSRDIYLTLDAALQVKLQQRLAEELPGEIKTMGPSLQERVRASVVVIDPVAGDLLCSANYPLPNQDSLREMDSKDRLVYRERKGQKAYTERDLGLTFQTSPGSTAKVMSAIAGLIRTPGNAGRIYKVKDTEAVEQEVRNGKLVINEPTGDVSMKDAIVKSSNCYFINLVNDQNLYPELTQLYSTVGARTDGKLAITPYFFNMDENTPARKANFEKQMNDLGAEGIKTYNDFKANHANVHKPGNQNQRFYKMNMRETMMAWGQGALTATPLNMARVAGLVANHGRFVPTRYILKTGAEDNPQFTQVAKAIEVITPDAANALRGYMQEESDKHRKKKNLPLNANLDMRMGGKTGTPEREQHYSDFKKQNDGWYICFVQAEGAMRSNNPDGILAIAVRLERLGLGGIHKTPGAHFTSGKAVDVVANIIIPTLNEAGYSVQ